MPRRERHIRRAAAACYRCHARKVRCNAATMGCPCTNCSLDGEYCELRPNSTARFKNIQKMTRNEFLPLSNPHRTNIYQHPTLLPLSCQQQIQGYSTTSQESHHIIFEDGFQDMEFPTNLPAPKSPRAECDVGAGLVPESGHPIPAFLDQQFLDLSRLSYLSVDDVHLLVLNNCFDIPSNPMLDVFIEKYFLLVHPSVPILDEARFWKIYLRSSENSSTLDNMSVFVFQTMLLTSCAFVPIEIIQQCGFSSTHETEQALYNRAKMLYDTNFENNVLCRAQGTLLLTHHTTGERPQAAMAWNLCSIANATSIGLHQDISEDDPDRSAKKRLAWAIFVCDRILWLGSHRCPHFISANFSIKTGLPEEEDFSEEFVSSQFYKPSVKWLLFRIFQSRCRLALILTDIIFIAFRGYIPPLSPDEFYRELQRIWLLKNTLHRWTQESELPGNDTSIMDRETINMLSNLTIKHYQTACMELANQEALLVEKWPQFSGNRLAGVL